MISPAVAKQAVAAILDWSRLRVHERIDDTKPIAIRLGNEVWFAAVLGGAGITHGLGFYGGQSGLEGLRRTQAASGDDQQRLPDCTLLSVTMVTPGSVTPAARGIATLGGCSDRLIPLFLTALRGERPRLPKAGELRLMTQLIEALARAERTGLLRPVELTESGPARVLTITVEGDGKARDQRVKYEVFSPAAAGSTVPDVLPAELAMPWDSLPVVAASWVVGLSPLPIRIADRETAPYAILAGDLVAETVVASRVLADDDLDAAIHALREIFAGASATHAPGIPEHVTFTSERLHARLAPVLGPLGVICESTPAHPLLDRLRQSLEDHLLGREPGAAPGASDADRWQAVYSSLMTRITEHKAFLRSTDPAVREAFFGPQRGGTMSRRDAFAATHAYFRWFATRWRQAPGSRTLAERMLAGELPEAERVLLEAMIGGRPGLWRVANSDGPLGTLVDTLTGESAEVHLGPLASVARIDVVLPGSVVTAGGYTSFHVLGPPLAPLHHDQGLAYLEGLGLEFTHETVARAPELLGRLWGLPEELARFPAKLQNLDGEPLAPGRSTLAVGDERALRAALAARDDLDPLAEPDRWCWVRVLASERRLLATLELIGGELLVSTNSHERRERALEWLTQIPGVRLVRTIDIARGARRPLDDVLASPLRPDPGPEEVAAAQRLADQRALSWLDQSLPALGGRTPREAAKDPMLRAKVARMIRALPRWSEDIDVPRQRLLDELGLEDSGAQGATGAAE